MSVFSETEEQIREVLDSLENQTFKNFEIIIILDDPNRNDVETIIDCYKDLNIIFYRNAQNIGLAMSMNKAASLANSDIFARMDADDVCEPQRLEKEYNAIKSNNVDLIFSRFSYIDMDSHPIKKDLIVYLPPEQLKDNPDIIVNHIHHPTVMYTKKIFVKSGGYRDFPCSQDLDLWLRMWEMNCRFLMLPDILLKYRISPNSISSRKWFQQQITCDYIWELTFERRKKGKDSFSSQNYISYVNKMGLGKKENEEKLRKGYAYLQKAQEKKTKGEILYCLFYRIQAIATSSILLRRAWLKLRLS